MWELKNGRTKLNISKIRKTFKVIEDDDLKLIIPQKNMWDWEDEEKFLRSIIVDKNGYVVSSGWPKFGNYGEFIQDTEVLNNALQNDDKINFTMKEDGSLCIRSVINDKVVLRTRGTMYGGDYDEEGNPPFRVKFTQVAETKYPKILDPNWMKDRSLLFEYVSPENRIVVGYSKEDLVFIGSIRHSDLKIGSWNELQKIAEEGKLNLVKLHNLPLEVSELLEKIKNWEDEGIVARVNNGEVLVKIKSASYLARHRLKSNLNYKFICEFIEMSLPKNKDDLENQLCQMGMDFETVSEAIKIYDLYCQAENETQEALNEAIKLYESFSSKETDPRLIRKDYAMIATKAPFPTRTFMFLLYDNKQQKLKDFYKKVVWTKH